MAEKSVSQNVVIVGFATLISRFGGLVREILLAHFFGAGVIKSAFDVAYRIPNLFRRLFGEGALSKALIPIYKETIEKEGKEAADKLAATVSGAMVAFLSIICAISIFATYPIAAWLGESSKWGEIMPLLRIMLPYAPLICLAALIMGVLNSLGSFALPSLAPAFQNFCCIIALACICPFLPAEGTIRIEVVSWSILVSGLVQVLVMVPALKKHNVPLKLILKGAFGKGPMQVYRFALPMTLSSGVVQINVCLDSILAMKAGEWGPSALSYADRLVYLPLAIVGTAFATVLLPTLSGFISTASYDKFSDTIARSIRNVIAILMPASVGMIVLSRPIISLIYETGQFDALSTTRTANALIAYSVGLVAAGLNLVAMQPFYAKKDSRTPAIIATAGVFVNLAMNLFFIWILKPELKPIGIAIATSISSTLSFMTLLYILSRSKENGVQLFSFKSVIRITVVSFLAAIVMALAVHYGYKLLQTTLEPHLPIKMAMALGVCTVVALGAAVYGAVLHILYPSVIREVISDFRAKGASR